MTLTPEDLRQLNRDFAAEDVQLLAMLDYDTEIHAMTNDQLAQAMLREAPIVGLLAHLVEAAAERLSPGVIERMADREVKP